MYILFNAVTYGSGLPGGLIDEGNQALPVAADHSPGLFFTLRTCLLRLTRAVVCCALSPVTVLSGSVCLFLLSLSF